MDKPLIMLLRPKLENNATKYIYEWGQMSSELIRRYEYSLIDVKKEDVNKINIFNLIKQHNPRMLISLSNGTRTCIESQNECIITSENRQDNILKNMMVIAIASYTADRLGKCLVSRGTESYFGYDDLFMFVGCDIKEEDPFRDIHLTYIMELLKGKTVKRAHMNLNCLENSLIKKYKDTKFISLPLLWNKEHRKILGNEDAIL